MGNLKEFGLEAALNWHARFTQQARWTQDIRRYLFERAGLAPGNRVLEVGCGTGAVLSKLVEVNCQVYGLDLDRPFLLQASWNAPATLLTQGDAHSLPYKEASFDIACCHFLLLWVNDPIKVLREMCRVVHPGGWVLALAEPDYGGRVDYPEALIRLGELQETALRLQGAETRLGRRLGTLFHSAGLQEVETGVLGGQWHEEPSPDDLAQEWDVIQTDLAEELLPEELTRLRQIEADAWARRERVLFVPTFYASGRK